MKLLQSTTIKLAMLIFFLITIWGVGFYFAMHHEIMDETDDMLRSYRDLFIKKALKDTTLLNTTFETTFDRYSIKPIDRTLAGDYKESWINEELYFPEGNEHIPVRVYRSIFLASNGRYYELEVKMSTMERDDMIQTLIFYLVGLFLLLILCIAVGNNLILKNSFKPLKKLLHWIRSFVPGKPVPPMRNDTNIFEFRQLNEAIYQMSIASLKVYELQKEFTENAAHELQTPLAIIRNKLEQFVQQEGLTEKQLAEIDRVYESLNRAIKLNKTMLLLSRIENRQFPDATNVDLNSMIKEILVDLSEMYEVKKIYLEIADKEPCQVIMNEMLARIMVSNLLKNAYIHTANNGRITVVVDKDRFTVRNSGEGSLEQDRIFDRFYQPCRKDNSTGLGLSIVKSICDQYRFSISYTFIGREHIFTIRFS